ncbi:MAG: DUF2062 domain-containing protein [Verrucomicrobiota bacterium]
MTFRIWRSLARNGISRRKLRKGFFYKWFGDSFLSKELWLMRPDTLAKGWLIGILLATSPFYGIQFPLAVALAVIFRANMPITILVQLLTNPFVAPFYYLGAFQVGSYLLGCNSIAFDLHNWQEMLSLGWKPLFLGCTLIGLTLGSIGCFLIHLIGRFQYRKKSMA